MSMKIVRAAVAATACALAFAASAQLTVPALPPPLVQSGVNQAFPTQNIAGPKGIAQQVNYPYPGQCLADPLNAKLFPLSDAASGASLIQICGLAAGSFADPSQRTAGGWATGITKDAKGNPVNVTFAELNAIIPNSVPLAGTPATPKFAQRLLNPIDYTPDTTTYKGADYYVIGLHESWGFQAIASAGLFPNPGAANPVPNGMQWTGLVCNAPPVVVGGVPTAGTCSCPADASASFKTQVCTAGGKILAGAPLFTPIWGVGQINMGGGPVTSVLSAGTCLMKKACAATGVDCTVNAGLCIAPDTCGPAACNTTVASSCGAAPDACAGPGPLGIPPLFTPAAKASAWSADNYIATWPSISIRANKGTPVVVKWTNEFPNNHVLCPHPEAADWPCAIDRTFMGVKARVDPGLASSAAVPPDGVNPYGSPQQPDNSWVTHLHGGEVPPSTDGFAEKWFGNLDTSKAYANLFVNPPFENPSFITLKRPGPAVNFDTYTYPMVQEEATIWFHDHTLGKTHHNVIAGPAGFFPVKEPLKHGWVKAGVCQAADCSYTWVDPVTEPRNGLGVPLYDLFLAVQDRSFNDDGSINFSNGLGQKIPAGKGVILPIGYTSVTPGVNPQVHPTWVPEYFGDHALVNGVLWPYHATARGWYRMRIVDGSDSRCWTAGLSTVQPAPGAKVTNDVPFYVIANDQGYLKNPVLAPGNQFTMCPGERYELLVNFGAVAAPAVYMTNSAPAPFPAGITPYANASPYAEMNVIMKFDFAAAGAPQPVKSCAAGTGTTWNPAWSQSDMAAAILAGTACMPANPALVTDPGFVDLRPVAAGTTVRQVYLNERADGVTLSPMGMQLNGVPFEYKVTETPRVGSREVWQFVNLTVDAHPMHPHLVAHQIVSRQAFNVGQYKALLCGSTTCQPGPAPGGEMQVVPDVTPLLTGGPVLVTAASIEGGRKDATQVPPGQVTTIVADWAPRWAGAGWGIYTAGTPNAPPICSGTPCTVAAMPWTYEAVTSGPYVWHCHINSHEDSEMMRTSLVVK